LTFVFNRKELKKTQTIVTVNVQIEMKVQCRS